MSFKNNIVRVGTRKSPLAIKQTNIVIQMLEEVSPAMSFELIEVGTKGDRDKKTALNKFGKQGVFTDEVEQAILNKEIDFAVHSMKDLPISIPNELVIASIPVRENPFDCIIMKDATTIQELRKGAIVGTSSLRRELEIKNLRPDILTKTIRGNIDQRIVQLSEGKYDAIILANAGLNRLGWKNPNGFGVEQFDGTKFIPSVGQGALALECASEDTATKKLLRKINHQDTYQSVLAERSLLRYLETFDNLSASAYGYVDRNQIQHLLGVLSTKDGSRYYSTENTGTDPIALGEKTGQELLKLIIPNKAVSL